MGAGAGTDDVRVNEPTEFFDAVVDASGLNRLIAPFTISRLLVRAGVTPGELSPEVLAQVLPDLEQGLAVYLRDDELDVAIANLRRLAGA